MFLKNRNISSKIKRSKVTDYAVLSIYRLSKIFYGLTFSLIGERFDILESFLGNYFFAIMVKYIHIFKSKSPYIMINYFASSNG